MPLTNAGRDNIAKLIAADSSAVEFGSYACLGVGDSTAAFAKTQTDLQAPTNKVRKLVSGAPTINVNQLTYKATFGTGDANFQWQEWGLFSASTGGVMLCRVVQSLGTKDPSSVWELTATITINNP